MRIFTLIFLALLLPLATLHAADTKKPNIVLILADDLGYGDVSCYNDQSNVATPHIDRLAREGSVTAVDTRDLWREADVSPKNQGYHYNRNAETYMETGLRLGWAMAELLEKK